jgi:hypothetical protein
MIIDNFDVVCIAIAPLKTDAPLVIDPNAVLTQTIASKLFQVIPRGHAQIGKLAGGI